MPADKTDLALEWARSAWIRLELELPVDLERVRKHLGLYLRVTDLGEGGGYLLKTPKRCYIVVNQLHTPERQRFSIAHEIGEHLLVRHCDRQARRHVQGELKERFCDTFAAALLMPEDAVRQHAERMFHDIRTNDKTPALAHVFGVSYAAMGRRLWELGVNRRGRTRRGNDYHREIQQVHADFKTRLDEYAAQIAAEFGAKEEGQVK